MNATNRTLLGSLALLGLAACGNGNEPATAADQAEKIELDTRAPAVTFKPGTDDYDGTVAKPGSPYAISYRIIGTPIVGSPVTVELRVVSAIRPQPVTLDYRINDSNSMLLAESQPSRVSMELAANEKSFEQQVTVIPQREGRFYLNVSASVETDDGTVSTVTAIPIQVGSGTRELQEHGELDEDESGEAIRVLSGD